MSFDPDKYLAGKSTQQSFDPDEYLKKKDISTFNPDEYLKKKDISTFDPDKYLGIKPSKKYLPPEGITIGKPYPKYFPQKETTIGMPAKEQRYESPIPVEEEIAFETERVLKPSLEQAAKQPENLRIISAEAFRKIDAPFPEFLADLTDPNTWGVGVALSPILNPIIKASFKYISKPIKVVAQPVVKWFENKIAERAARKAIHESLFPKPIPQKIVSLAEARGDIYQKILPLKEEPINPQVILNTQPLPQNSIPIEKTSYLKRIDDMIEQSPSKSLLKSTGEFDSTALKLKTQMMDKYAPVYSLVKKTEEITGKVIPFEEDPYSAVRLYAGVGGKAEMVLNKLRDILKPVRFKNRDLERYMVGHRAVERAERGFANPADVTAYEAKKGLQELRTKLGDKIKTIEDVDYRIRTEISTPLLDRLEKSGVISAESKQKMIAKGQSWAPFDVVEYLSDNESAVALGTKSVSVGSQDIVKYLTGTEKKIRPPLDSLVSRIYKTTEFADRNMVIRKIAHLRNLSPQMEELILNKVDKLPFGYKSVSFYEDGIRKGIGVPNAIADSLTGMNQYSFDFMTRFAGLGSQALRLGATTLNIPFALISNPIRDFQTLAITTGKGWGVFPSWVRGFFSAISKDDLYKEFMASGGAQSGYMTYYTKGPLTAGAVKELGITKFAKTVTNPVQLVKYVGEVLELSPRLAAMNIALKRGLSSEQAALIARESTVDFSRSGTVGKLVNMWVPFLNARLQGTLILGKAIKDKPVASTFNLVTMAGLPAYATYVYNRKYFSELYDQIPAYEKENNFIIMLGSKKNETTGQELPHYVAIPKGDVGRIFGNPIELACEWAWKNKKIDIFETGLKILSDVSPIEFEYEGKIAPTRAVGMALPPLARGLVEVGIGKSFYFQNDIIPGWLKDVKTKSLQYTQRTPRTLVWLGEQTNTSPMLWEHFLRTTFGTGVFQVLEPHKIPAQLRQKIIHVKGGNEAESIYSFKEEMRGEKADIRVQIQHAFTDILTGNSNQQEAGKRVLEKIIPQIPSEDRPKFMRYQLNSVLGRQLPPEYKAFKGLSKQERREYITRKALETP